MSGGKSERTSARMIFFGEYEVVSIQIAPAAVSPSGTLIPKREEYPSSSKWGTLGWSIPKRDQATAWAEMAVGNLELPREGRTAWPELFSRFKTKICNQIKKNGLQVVHGHCRWDDSSRHAKNYSSATKSEVV